MNLKPPYRAIKFALTSVTMGEATKPVIYWPIHRRFALSAIKPCLTSL